MNIIDRAIEFIAPHNCVGCGAEGAVMCRPCILTYPTLPSICYICARATSNHAPCSAHAVPRGPLECYIAGEYDGVLLKLIQSYKFDYRRAAAKDLALFLDLIVPYESHITISYVPTTGSHIRERGFDHTKTISKKFAAIRKLSHAETLVRVTSATQKGASRLTRKQQLNGAFRAIPSRVKSKNILLIDDVITTGATIEECARQLNDAGAASVCVAAIARTP